MVVIDFEIRRRGPYLDGQGFGETGAYERIDGWLRFAVDPAHAANATITDLALAPRDDRGRVHFGADVCLLVPADPSLGNHRLFLELPNRGRKLAPRLFNRAPTEVPPTASVLPGDGFLFRHGFTVGWIGWQWDVVRSDALMGLEAPQALVDGRPVRGTTIVRFQPNVVHRTHLLADRVHQPYSAADVEQSDAVLRVRDYDAGEPRVVPRQAWRFAREEGERIVPDAEHVYLADGFEPGRIYELLYATARAPVVGCGLLAVRDAASFLRHGPAPDNPLAGSIERVYGWGMSQTGRMLRHFLFLGLNLDEEGRQVFDGLNPHVGGARRGEFNQRFGQPSVQATPGPGFLPPFDDAGLFARQRELGGMPKVVQTNSSAEYWRGDCALMHVDTEGTRDLPSEPEARIYHFAGTQHGPGAVPLTRYNPNDGARGRFGFNAVDYTPLQRAVLVNLDHWASAGVEPPPSVHPRLVDGTLVPRQAHLNAFAELPGVGGHIPDATHFFRLPVVDPGPDAERGIVRQPVGIGAEYPSLVPAVDADGNELGGIRLPDLTVPVATNAGWNPRDPETGAPEQIMPMQGMTLFLARERAEREAAGDPRPSLAERYASRNAYLERVREDARRLAAERFILEEDIEIAVADAAARYDDAMRASAPIE
jgi:hypothetical protein